MDFQGIIPSLPVTQNDITVNFVKTFSYDVIIIKEPNAGE